MTYGDVRMTGGTCQISHRDFQSLLGGCVDTAGAVVQLPIYQGTNVENQTNMV